MLAKLLGSLIACAAMLIGGCAAPRYTSLKEAYAGRFLVGTAYDPANFSPAEVENIQAHYNVVTPENCMKPASIHPREDAYNFGQPDTLVSWAEANQMQIVGHTLVWHNQTGNWFFQNADGTEVDAETLRQRLRSHIHTVVGRYKGRIKGWDVVNEAIDDNNTSETAKTEHLRNSNWLRILGPEYLTLAFKWAHEADPQAELYYNDYNIERGFKHESSMRLLKRLLAEGAPITAVGIQGHWDLNPNYAAIEKAIRDYRSLGLKVMITELDVTTRGTNTGALPGFGLGAAAQAAATRTAEEAATQAAADAAEREAAWKKQAVAYERLFKIFDRHAGTVTRVTFWGINDRRSWRATQQPLIFDGQMRPKPAFQAVLDAAHKRPWFPLPF